MKIYWILNLPEIGTPFRKALKELEQLDKQRKEIIASIRSKEKGILEEVRDTWTPNEISAARRGETVIEPPPFKGRKSVTFSELAALHRTQKDRLSRCILHEGARKRWVGIGWIDEGAPKGDELEVIDD